MTTAERVIRHHFAPRGAARTLFTDKSPELLLSGPAGTGKSRACLEKLNFCALKYAGMRGLIVRKTATSLTNTALDTYRKAVAKEILANRAVYWYGGSGQEPAQFRYSNGSTLNVGGMDKPSRIMSSEYDMIFVQEAIELTVTDWESLTTRLRNGVMPYQQMIADTNPDSATHWLHRRALDGKTRMLHSVHADNPMLYDDAGAVTEQGAAYIAKLAALTGVRRMRLKDGLWVAAEGVVYDEWRDDLHWIPRFDIPHDWPRYWGVDFGHTNPMVLHRWAEDPDGRLYLYREHYRTKQLVEDVAREVLRDVTKQRTGEWKEPKPRAIICDHDAEDRATLERHLGLSTVAARKEVKPGIDAVQARLRPAGDGKPRLFVFQDALARKDQDLEDAGRPTCTKQEVGSYVWDESKDAPVKENDHGLDTTRYVVAHRDLRGEFKVRFM